MSQALEQVRERLLRAGIAPRHVHRYVAELQDHLVDLVAQQRASGLDADQARQRAMALLGSEAQLVQAMIDSGAPRSLAARAPWAVFVLLPMLLLVAVVAATGFSMMQLLLPVRGLAPADMPVAYAGLIAVVGFVTGYVPGPMLAASCIAMALRQRLATRWLWVGLLLVALFSGAFGFHMHFIPPGSGGPGGPVFSAVGVVYENGRPDLAASLSLALLRAAILFAAAGLAYRALRARFTRRAA